MIRVMVVDDEKFVMEKTVAALKAAGAEVVAEFTRPKHALNWFRDNHASVDAVFLDVAMPVLDGFDVAKVINDIAPDKAVVFVTAYDKYAVKAFEVAAVDYLLKPPDLERIRRSLLRISENIQATSSPGDTALLADLERTEVKEEKRLWQLLLEQMSGEHKDEVLLYSDADWRWITKAQVSCFYKGKNGKYVQVIADGKLFETMEALDEFALAFPMSFWIMCYRAYYVNARHIEKYVGLGRYESYLLLKGSDKKIPVSRGYSAAVLQAIDESKLSCVKAGL